MSDSTPQTGASNEPGSGTPEIQINIKGPSELKLQISISPDKSVWDLKQAIAGKSEVEAERQRLIYSGRVLKNEDLLSTYKVQTNHTIHMVKGAPTASSSNPSASAAAPTPQPLPSMQTGQNPHDPLTLLNSHLGYGAMAGLNPFADMGLNANDPNMLQTMMNSPQFLQQMSAMMANPQIMDQIIASNPQLAAMGPQVRAAFQSEEFREMMANPERLQQMLRMAQMFGPPGGGGLGGLGAGGLGNPFGQPAGGFPAPGVPGGAPSTPGSTAATTPSTGGAGATAAGTPPFMNLFGAVGDPAAAGAGAGTPGATTGAGAANPFGMNPALLQHLMAGGGGFGSPFGAGTGAFGAPQTPAAPADTRSPEERFQVQLQQLQDMGFNNASQNVRALLATAGNVHSAIEYILGGGGL